MLDVGYWLGKQSDPVKTRTHFHSGYSPKAGKGDDNTTEKKQAHEMDAKRMKLEQTSDPKKVIEKGYYPCVENILYKNLTFCDPLGINISSPPEALHAMLLGHGTRLLNAFARVENIKSKEQEIQEDAEEESLEEEKDEDKKQKPNNKRKAYVLTGSFRAFVDVELKKMGYWLNKQSDPDKIQKHFRSGYLPKVNKSDDNTTGKKQAHEMRGVLLTILCFCLCQ